MRSRAKRDDVRNAACVSGLLNILVIFLAMESRRCIGGSPSSAEAVAMLTRRLKQRNTSWLSPDGMHQRTILAFIIFEDGWSVLQQVLRAVIWIIRSIFGHVLPGLVARPSAPPLFCIRVEVESLRVVQQLTRWHGIWSSYPPQGGSPAPAGVQTSGSRSCLPM